MASIFRGHLYEAAAMILFAVGLTTLLLHRNMIKKIIGMNIMDTAVYLFLASMGYIRGRSAPILEDGAVSAENCRKLSVRHG